MALRQFMLFKNILKTLIILEREDKTKYMHFNMQLRTLKSIYLLHVLILLTLKFQMSINISSRLALHPIPLSW